MAISAALNYALNNGSTEEQYYKQIFDAFAKAQAQGLSDAQIEIGMNQYGISAGDLARATGVTPESVQARMEAAAPTTEADLAYERAAQAELAARQRQEQTRLASLLETTPVVTPPTVVTPPVTTTPVVTPPTVVTPPVVTTPVVKPPVVTPPVVKPPVTPPATNTALNAQLEKAYKDGDIALLNSLLAQNQVTSAQAKNMFNLTDADLSWIQNNAGGKFYTPATAAPGANMGIGGSFANFQSIPIGAQFNPAVTAGGASPYSQIMGQMRPLGNPYAGVVGNLSMGGYDPALYERIAAANLARDVAAKSADNAARLAGLFERFVNNDGVSVSQDSFQRAAKVAAWHLEEVKRFFGEIGLSQVVLDAVRLESWLVDFKHKEELSQRYTQRYGPFRDKKRLDSALTELESLDRIKLVQEGKRKLIKVNPMVLK